MAQRIIGPTSRPSRTRTEYCWACPNAGVSSTSAGHSSLTAAPAGRSIGARQAEPCRV